MYRCLREEACILVWGSFVWEFRLSLIIRVFLCNCLFFFSFRVLISEMVGKIYILYSCFKIKLYFLMINIYVSV